MFGDFPDYNFHPTRVGYGLKWNWLTSVPGYWQNGEQHNFPFMSFYSRHALKLRQSLSVTAYPDTEDAVDGMGLMSSFAWLNAFASHHGFTPYQELTYPFTCQSVVTDGQYWTFIVYQLNGHSFHGDFSPNPVKNICWSSGEMKLFDECKDGQLTNVNDQVIDNLIKVMIKY